MTRKKIRLRPMKRRASVELLRAEAQDERTVLIEERLRLGEDPWEFMEELPSIDDIVIYGLRAEYILDEHIYPTSDEENAAIFTEIARAYPALATVIAPHLELHLDPKRVTSEVPRNVAPGRRQPGEGEAGPTIAVPVTEG